MEPNDRLWKLLGKSQLPEPDAWFAARTLARCRREAAGFRWNLAWPGWGWLTASALAVALVFNLSSRPSGDFANAAKAPSSAKVQEALNYLADRGGDVDLWLD